MEWLKEWCWWFVTKFTEFWYNLGEGLVDTMVGLMPTEWQSSTIAGSFGTYWTVGNAWLPLSEALGLYTSMTVFHFGVIALRWIVKMIPGLGGCILLVLSLSGSAVAETAYVAVPWPKSGDYYAATWSVPRRTIAAQLALDEVYSGTTGSVHWALLACFTPTDLASFPRPYGGSGAAALWQGSTSLAHQQAVSADDVTRIIAPSVATWGTASFEFGAASTGDLTRMIDGVTCECHYVSEYRFTDPYALANVGLTSWSPDWGHKTHPPASYMLVEVVYVPEGLREESSVAFQGGSLDLDWLEDPDTEFDYGSEEPPGPLPPIELEAYSLDLVAMPVGTPSAAINTANVSFQLPGQDLVQYRLGGTLTGLQMMEGLPTFGRPSNYLAIASNFDFWRAFFRGCTLGFLYVASFRSAVRSLGNDRKQLLVDDDESEDE